MAIRSCEVAAIALRGSGVQATRPARAEGVACPAFPLGAIPDSFTEGVGKKIAFGLALGKDYLAIAVSSRVYYVQLSDFEDRCCQEKLERLELYD